MRPLMTLVALLVAGCATTAPAIVCTPVPRYSLAVQVAAAKELAEVKGVAPNLARLINDFRRVRKAIEACEDAK